MTTQEVLDIVRLRVGQAIQEIGGDPPTYPDELLIKYINLANNNLSILGIYGSTTPVTVDVGNVSITPDTSIVIGMLLASFAASTLISDDVLNRLKKGELGVSFTSGATSISTNQAAINLKASAQSLNAWYNLLLTAYLSGDPNAVLARSESSNATG